MKQALLFSISLMFIFSLCGCGTIASQDNTDDSSPIVIKAAASTQAVSLTPTLDPILTPTPTATPNDQQSQLEASPEIEGLTKTIRDNSIVYTYNEENPYGGTSGEYAGIYKANVVIDGDKVGGVCMEAKVCKKLLEDALAEMPEDKSKVKIVIPLDVTNYDGNFDLKLTLYNGNNLGWYTCFFDESLNFVSVYSDESWLWFSSKNTTNNIMSTYDGKSVPSDLFVINNGSFTDDSILCPDIDRLFYSLPNSSIGYDSNFEGTAFGKSMGTVSSSITIGFSKYVDNVYDVDSLSANSLLTLDNGSLVFIEESNQYLYLDKPSDCR